VAAAPGHVGEIRRRLFDPLTAEEAAMLGTISAKVAQAVRAPV